MFKKGQKLPPAPKPITVEQVLSDLETFAVPKSEIIPNTRSLPSPNDPDYEQEWWKMFETFMGDLELLKRLQETLDVTKARLTERRAVIGKQIDKLEREMGKQKTVIDGVLREL